MTEIIYFLFGIIFVIVIVPLLQEAVDLLVFVFDVFRSKMNLKIAKNKKEINQLVNEEPCESHVIGFQIPDESYTQYDECDDKCGGVK